ncbi:MAG TPA: polysaccharide biosynthesis C-terminal domain-containing protein [Candidatus Blautia faecavium]|uniref:Probable multidrug resistance protein NorM n=1 Tax=Candidatus Blautia faecavium TaxID=2838487 RepID=A0A9D2LTH0_9FIRM|nr:polysaccharide biosynthesis C-terminal domain-containing protein [Candidatus Blautia faecavium]
MDTTEFFGNERISKILFKLAPPVMLAQLIQALYNIVDSLFVGRYSDSGLTALSIIYPIQLLMIALAVGTGVGINTVMAARLGVGNKKEADEYAGTGTPLALALWLLFSFVCWFLMPAYAKMSTDSPAVINDVVIYGRIVCVFSFGLFLESIWTKVLQANGDMKTPMVAQIVGAVTNIVFDPLLIFGLFGLPEMGIGGAAAATAAGQIAAALIVMKKGFRKPPAKKLFPHHVSNIFRLGMPNILMQTCIVPVISFNYAAKNIDRCKKVLKSAILFGLSLISIGTICFLCIPGQMLLVFTSDKTVIEIGKIGFHFVGISFLPMVTSLIFPVFFQAIGASLKSSLLTIIRTVILFVPLGFLFSRFGLTWFWLTFPVTEILTSLAGAFYYRQFLQANRL